MVTRDSSESDDGMLCLRDRVQGGVGGWLDEEEDGWRAEVGESYYLDMLRDDARNKAYRDGIERAVERINTDRGVSSVLDIGTGSGLLAMMAKRAGATHVTACECFAPVARSAAACLRANNMDTTISLVHKASTEMFVGDLESSRRVDIIVNELYDTELLGEGILPTLRHALQQLARPDCVVLPAAADVVAVLLQSDALISGYHPSQAQTAAGHKIFPQTPASTSLPPQPPGPASSSSTTTTFSSAWSTTYVSESMFLDQLIAHKSALLLSDPVLVTSIDFCSPPETGTHALDILRVSVGADGVVHAVAYWWDLKMCVGDRNPLAAHPARGKGDRPTVGVLSMAPGEGWRDHWRQNICVLDKPISVQKGDLVELQLCHDDWRIWFQVSVPPLALDASLPPPLSQAPAEMPLARVLYGGHTLRLLSNTSRAAAYSKVLQNMFLGSSVDSSVAKGDGVGGGGGRQGGMSRSEGGGGDVTLALGDGHWLALAAVEAGAERVVDVESTPHALRMASHCFAAANLPPSRIRAWQADISARTVRHLLERSARARGRGGGEEGKTEKEEEEDEDEEDPEIGALGLGAGAVGSIVADPFFLESHLGASAGGGGSQWNNLIFWTQVHTLGGLLRQAPPATIVPCGARVFGVAVEMQSLRNSQEPVDVVEGFDLSRFSDIQPCSRGQETAGVAYDLSMYNWRPLTAEFQVMSLDFTQPPDPALRSSRLHSTAQCHVIFPGDEAAHPAHAGRTECSNGGGDVIVGDTVEFESDGTCHAVVMWLEWQLDARVSVSCAPSRTSLDSHKPLVYFLERGVRVTAARQRLRLLGATLDMLQHELLAAFSVE